jgi:hypothetical protein
MPQTFARTQVGVKEDLADFIYNIDAKQTPLLSAIPKGRTLVNNEFSWQVDAYDTPNTTAVPDGTDVSTTEDAAENRIRLHGRCVELRRTPKVSNRTEVNNGAGQGQGQEFAKGVIKKLVELKRDLECTLGGDQESSDDDGVTGSKTRGLGKWIQSTAQTHLPVDSKYRPASASIDTTAMASLTPAVINAVLESQYGAVGAAQEYMLVVGTTLKKTITSVSGYQPTVGGQTAILRTETGSSSRWDNNVVSFSGDFGSYDIVLSNYLAWNNTTKVADARRGYALDMDMVELRMHNPWQKMDLPDLGGGKRALLRVIAGLCVKNPKGLAAFKATA